MAPMAAQAAGGCPRHQQLRTLATQLGLKNSFLGANEPTLETLAAMRQQHFRTPAVYATKTSHLATQGADYEELLQRVRLDQLAEAFPSDAWQHFLETGWAAMPMHAGELDRRFLHACTLCNLANLGVTPTRADTYLNAEGQAGYDFTNGWLRNPGTTPNGSFVSTHPSVFRLTVGFLARRQAISQYDAWPIPGSRSRLTRAATRAGPKARTSSCRSVPHARARSTQRRSSG